MNPVKQLLGHLISCRNVSQLLSRMQDESLTDWQRVRVRWHLAVCRMCMAFERQLRFIEEAMKRYRS